MMNTFYIIIITAVVTLILFFAIRKIVSWVKTVNDTVRDSRWHNRRLDFLYEQERNLSKRIRELEDRLTKKKS